MDSALEKRLEHIEMLLQKMPEMIAAAYFLEQERKEKNIYTPYSEQIVFCPINER